MNKNRLEAFTDGIFAIVTTILVLDIRLPELDFNTEAGLKLALLKTLPNIITYLITFLVIGIFWVAHHRIFTLVKKVNHYILWSNIIYLMNVALIPFPASVLAKHPFYATSIIIYSITLLTCGVQHFIILNYLHKHKEFAEPFYSNSIRHAAFRVAAVGPVCYALAIVASIISPFASFFFFLTAIIFYIFFSQYFMREIERK